MDISLDLEQIKPDKILDTRGLYPPMPVLKTEKALKDLKKGKILEIWCTDCDARMEIPQLCCRIGSEYLGCLSDPGGYKRFFIRIK